MCIFRSLLGARQNPFAGAGAGTATGSMITQDPNEEDVYVPPMLGVKSGGKYKRNMAKRREYWRDKRAAERERAAADLKIEPDINDPNPTPDGGINV